MEEKSKKLWKNPVMSTLKINSGNANNSAETWAANCQPTGNSRNAPTTPKPIGCS